MRTTTIVRGLILLAVLAALGWTATFDSATAAEIDTSLVSDDAQIDGPDAMTAASQVGDEGTNSEDNDRVPVQVWTLVTVVGAMGVGLLLYLLRMAMGWVKPPPAKEEAQH